MTILVDTLPILDSLFSVERNDKIYQVKGRDFLNRVQLNDLIHVQRDEQDYKCSWNRLNQWNNLRNNDLILAQYENELYQVKGSDFKFLFPTGELRAELTKSNETDKNSYYYRNGHTARITISASGGWKYRMYYTESRHDTGPGPWGLLLPSQSNIDVNNRENLMSNVPTDGYILHRPHSSSYTQTATGKYKIIVDGPQGNIETVMTIEWRP